MNIAANCDGTSNRLYVRLLHQNLSCLKCGLLFQFLSTLGRFAHLVTEFFNIILWQLFTLGKLLNPSVDLLFHILVFGCRL
jgi:hypothetical protein